MLALLLAAVFPAFTGYVVDSAGVIPPDDAKRISAVCERLDRGGTAQIAVATVRDLGELDRKQYANELFEKWKLGHSKERSDGLLLLLAPSKTGKLSGLKVEVGYGLEGILPDGKVGAFMDQHAGPHLREGHPGPALVALVNAFAAEIESHASEITGRTQSYGTHAGQQSGSTAIAAPSSEVSPQGARRSDQHREVQLPEVLFCMFYPPLLLFAAVWSLLRVPSLKKPLTALLFWLVAVVVFALCGVLGLKFGLLAAYFAVAISVVHSVGVGLGRCRICGGNVRDRKIHREGGQYRLEIACSRGNHVELRDAEQA